MEFLENLAEKLWNSFPTLRRTNPQVAAALGFFFGGIGLGIYFRSFVDFIAPLAIAIVASLIVIKLGGAEVGLGWLVGAIIASLYGYSRSRDSNKRRDVADRADPVVQVSPTTPESSPN